MAVRRAVRSASSRATRSDSRAARRSERVSESAEVTGPASISRITWPASTRVPGSGISTMRPLRRAWMRASASGTGSTVPFVLTSTRKGALRARAASTSMAGVRAHQSPASTRTAAEPRAASQDPEGRSSMGFTGWPSEGGVERSPGSPS